MRRRDKVAPKARPESWITSHEIQVSGRWVRRGDEITVRDHDGRRRRVRFVEHVINTALEGANEWVTVAEPMEKGSRNTTVRSFDPSRIMRVHIKKKERK